MKLFLNDDWVSSENATISVMDLSVLRGFGIFDFLQTYGTMPFRLDDHIERFMNSARLMGMKPRYTKDEIASIIHEGIKKNGFKQTNIKFIQTGGVSSDGFLPAVEQTFFVYFYEAHEYPTDMYENGISLATVNLMRQLPEAKTINYAASISEVVKAQKKGAVDILHIDQQGNIYEGTRSNFFAVKGGKLITANSGILAGITRKVILEIAENISLPVEFEFPHVSELETIDEAFVSNSSQEIMPVTTINGIKIGIGKKGEITSRLLKEFRKAISQ